jgi:hypothetical protein
VRRGESWSLEKDGQAAHGWSVEGSVILPLPNATKESGKKRRDASVAPIPLSILWPMNER